jgi:hypothetical protein
MEANPQPFAMKTWALGAEVDTQSNELICIKISVPVTSILVKIDKLHCIQSATLPVM